MSFKNFKIIIDSKIVPFICLTTFNLMFFVLPKDNECIQTCLQCFDPDDICAANLVERAELLITLVTFLRETCFLSQTLLDDFKQTSGYRIVIDMILRLERDAAYKDDSAKMSVLRRLFLALEELVYSGYVELKPVVSNLNTNVFKIDGFQVPQPLGRGKTVRNTLAFQCLLNLFNKVLKLLYSLISKFRFKSNI